MRIVHIGPPRERTGGPGGYLLELSRAAETTASREHEVIFPDHSTASPPSTRRAPATTVVRRLKRALLGPPSFYRPGDDDIRRRGGPMDTLLSDSARRALEACEPSLAIAKSERPDVIFVHEVFAADAALGIPDRGEVWLFIHAPMPAALYLAWCWGRPDLAWEEIAGLPDVRHGIEEELRLWSSVDRLVLPTAEALGELERVDPRFGDVETPIEYVLTGSSVGSSSAENSHRDQGIRGLFLGNAQPYRGLDVLTKALYLLPSGDELPGVLLVAGPDPDSLPAHPRLRPLGRVRDVPGLLASVDFVVNTNRFSLFDLSNIEATAAGKALLLHRTGGNRALERLGAGCRCFAELTPAAVARELTAMFSMPRAELDALGRASRECYERHLTAESMWSRHLDLYDRASVRMSGVASAST